MFPFCQEALAKAGAVTVIHMIRITSTKKGALTTQVMATDKPQGMHTYHSSVLPVAVKLLPPLKSQKRCLMTDEHQCPHCLKALHLKAILSHHEIFLAFVCLSVCLSVGGHLFVVCLWLLYLALYHGISSLLDLTYWDYGQVWSFSPAEALHAFCKDCSGLVSARAVFLCPNCKEVSVPLVG